VKQKTYNIVTGTIFLVVAIVHFARIIFSWQMVVGGLVIPIWISWIGLVVAGVIAYLGFKLSKQS
jgi:hypothetical protein